MRQAASSSTRITELRVAKPTKKLVERITPKNPNAHLKTLTQSKEDLKHICHRFIACPNQQSYSSASTAFGDILSSESTRKVSVSFKAFGSTSVLIGVEFGGSDKTTRLGVCRHNSPYHTELQPGEVLHGLIVGVKTHGIVSLELLIQSKRNPNQTRKCRFGDFNGQVAIGKLESNDRSIKGISCEFEKVSLEAKLCNRYRLFTDNFTGWTHYFHRPFGTVAYAKRYSGSRNYYKSFQPYLVSSTSPF